MERNQSAFSGGISRKMNSHEIHYADYEYKFAFYNYGKEKSVNNIFVSWKYDSEKKKLFFLASSAPDATPPH